jgi:hypothetical protein
MSGTEEKGYVVVPFAENGEGVTGRLQVCDASGKALDDAQGYGYKSAEAAHRAWHYKQNRETIEARNQKIYRWRKEHKEFLDVLESMFFVAYKEGEDVKASDVEELLRRDGIDPASLGFKPALLLSDAGVKAPKRKKKKRGKNAAAQEGP